MDKYIKVLAVVLTLFIVASFYPAIVWKLAAHPFFWLLYIICIAADFWCISYLKKFQK